MNPDLHVLILLHTNPCTLSLRDCLQIVHHKAKLFLLRTCDEISLENCDLSETKKSPIGTTKSLASLI